MGKIHFQQTQALFWYNLISEIMFYKIFLAEMMTSFTCKPYYIVYLPPVFLFVKFFLARWKSFSMVSVRGKFPFCVILAELVLFFCRTVDSLCQHVSMTLTKRGRLRTSFYEGLKTVLTECKWSAN